MGGARLGPRRRGIPPARRRVHERRLTPGVPPDGLPADHAVHPLEAQHHDCGSAMTAASRAPGRPLEVGLFVPTWTGGMDGRSPRWRDIMALATRAEEVG